MSEDQKVGETSLAEHVAATIQDGLPAGAKFQAVIQPSIPPHIAGNLLEFLRRVQSTGMEAVAWVEAYTYVQQHAPKPQQGVPFSGLPAAPPKG